MILNTYLAAAAAVVVFAQTPDGAEGRWSVERVNAWYATRPLPVGCNFIPSTAINELEMWQADTFDAATIDRELGWAEGIGFNTVRVFLHDIAWRDDPEGFLKRMDGFLAIAERHGIAPLFVLFDSCWDPFPKSGKQRDPKPHVHNSGWLQCPSLDVLKDPARHGELEPYVKAVLTRFAKDPRILGWDLYNEPGNINPDSYEKLEPPNKAELCLMLLEKAYAWAREVNPEQPLTVGVWQGEWAPNAELTPLTRFMIDHSDFISFHSYSPLEEVQKRVDSLRGYGRPIVCTEYMSRPTGSTFAKMLPYFKENRVGAINWGLVSGKTQTIYPWESWVKPFTEEPPVWFHDIFRPDGTPFDPAEPGVIRKHVGK
ncbi:MAG: cellulase family glycosylhydrolase [Candidatus Hydrogenedentes bacterium]|nr:cellulase family glycosylhydrolase [Candidatus Hydrogenedentota bacterium]